MSKKMIALLCLVVYLVAGFFYFNPWAIQEILGNEVTVEIPEIFADNSDNNEQENSSWNGHYVLIRLEDVHPSRNLATLTDCVKLLQSKNIPFSIALTPIYKNPEKNITIYLHEKPELVKIIKDSGATIVLHGCTHQYNGETGVDFEFWDEILNQPILVNNTEYAISKVELALGELDKCNLSTEIWETPNYKSTYEAAKVVSQYFTKTYERTGDKLVINEFGQIVIPTNLYYVKVDEPIISVFQMLQAAEEISKNNDNDTVASFYYHSFLGSDYLRTMIGGLNKQGYRFVSPEKYILSVDPENIETVQQYAGGDRNESLYNLGNSSRDYKDVAYYQNSRAAQFGFFYPAYRPALLV